MHTAQLLDVGPLLAHVAAHVPLTHSVEHELLHRAGSTGGPSLGSGGGITGIASTVTMSPTVAMLASSTDGCGTHCSVPGGQSAVVKHGHAATELHRPHGRFCHTVPLRLMRAPRRTGVSAVSDVVPRICAHDADLYNHSRCAAVVSRVPLTLTSAYAIVCVHAIVGVSSITSALPPSSVVFSSACFT